MIIDASTSTVDIEIGEYHQWPPLDKIKYTNWLVNTGKPNSLIILRLIEYVSKYYQKIKPVYHESWDVYVRK